MAMSTEKIMGAIQCVSGGPRLVHANPNSPIVSSGAATRHVSCAALVTGRRIEGHTEEQPVETDFGRNGIWVVACHALEALKEREEREPGNEVSDEEAIIHISLKPSYHDPNEERPRSS